MALASISLPSINGAYELGLSVGIDAGVSEDLKLPVLSSGEDTAIYQTMISFIASSPTFDACGIRAKQYLAAAVTGICQAKLLRLRGVGADLDAENVRNLVPDGDWKTVVSPINATVHIGHESQLVVDEPSHRAGCDGGLCPKGGFSPPCRLTREHQNGSHATDRALEQHSVFPGKSWI